MLKGENQEATFMDISLRFSCASIFQALYFLTEEKKNLYSLLVFIRIILVLGVSSPDWGTAL